MRKKILLMENWSFTDRFNNQEMIDLPHTWNNIDGQDGGNDYFRSILNYEKQSHFLKFFNIFDFTLFFSVKKCIFNFKPVLNDLF